ncbi:hypothetical protein D3C85_965130 [compost metagenome]
MQHFGLVLEAETRGHWAEGFVLGDQHFAADLGEDGWLVERAAQRMTATAAQDLGALLQSVAHMQLDLCKRRCIDQRTLLGFAFQRIAHAHRRHRFGELSGEGFVHALLDEEAVHADAGLPGVAEFRSHRAFHRGIEIGVVEDNERRVSTQFQRDLFQGVGGLAHQQLAGAS